MKKESIRNLLGVTQEQMATLLGVSRGHFSMYELGKRDLPLHATQRLGEILQHTQAASKPSRIKPQNPELKKQLEKLLHENEFQQQSLSRKLATILRKAETAEKITQFASSLKNAKENNPSKEHHALTEKTTQKAKNVEPIEIIKLEVKLELLKFEKELYLARIKNRK